MTFHGTAVSAAAAAALLFVLLPRGVALAHHGGGVEYDVSQLLGPLTGEVAEFAYRFPHPQIYVDVTTGDGEVVRWAMVMQPTPTVLRRNHGITRDSIRPGDTLTVHYSPHRTTEHVGFAQRLEVNGELIYEQ